MNEEEKIKRISKLRTILKKRIEEIQTELSGFEAILEFVDKVLVKEGFKKAESTTTIGTPLERRTPITTKDIEEAENYIPLKAVTGETLVKMLVQEKLIQVLPIKDMKFTANIPPFSSFLVNRVLEGMRKKDLESVNKGRLNPDQMFSYEVINDDGIQEIMIRNATPDRVRELKSAIRWTFEKMWQKRLIEDT